MEELNNMKESRAGERILSAGNGKTISIYQFVYLDIPRKVDNCKMDNIH